MSQLFSASTVKSFRHAKDFISAWHGPLTRYERHISAAAMAGGFAVDNYTFGRIDRPAANIIFSAYLALAAITIAALHFLQSRADRVAETAEEPEGTAVNETLRSRLGSRLHTLIPAATQFALGGLWSGFLVFYLRSAVIAASWPFLLLLGAVFLGNEFFRRYNTRLVFAALLLFFALYSYAIFVVPVFTRTIGSLTFAASGAIATVLFVVFLLLLRALGRERYSQSRWALFGGTAAIVAAMNFFYFTDILPPLPLALSNVGVYHTVKRNGPIYTAAAEAQPLTTLFDFSHPVMHVAPGETLSVYSAVFAPINLTTRIAHRWRWYDPQKRHWILQSVVSFRISGGREGGYRGYSIKSKPKPGAWRVDIDTIDGRLIGRVEFQVEAVPAPIATTQKTIG
jgi:hypothetical protein